MKGCIFRQTFVIETLSSVNCRIVKCARLNVLGCHFVSGILGWHPTGLRKLSKLNKACQRDEGPRWQDSDWRRPFKLFILINTATNRTSNTDTNTAANTDTNRTSNTDTNITSNTDTNTDINTDTNRGSNRSLQYTNRSVSLLSKVFANKYMEQIQQTLKSAFLKKK